MPTVLVIGASGNIGIAAIVAALNLYYRVLAIVRSQKFAEKLFARVGTCENITTVEADIVSDSDVKAILYKVRQGKLPAFQHVYSAVAYQATTPYLLEQADPTSTWTLCPGASADMGTRAAAGMTQGALVSMTNVACVDNKDTNIRFNEVYLAMLVIADAELAEKYGALQAAAFAPNYEQISQRPEVESSRVFVTDRNDVGTVRFTSKLLHVKSPHWVGVQSV